MKDRPSQLLISSLTNLERLIQAQKDIVGYVSQSELADALDRGYRVMYVREHGGSFFVILAHENWTRGTSD